MFALSLEVGWYVFLEGRLGWSRGKLLLGLRVARVEGGPPGIVKEIIRALAMIIPGGLGISVGLLFHGEGARATATLVASMGLSVPCSCARDARTVGSRSTTESPART